MLKAKKGNRVVRIPDTRKNDYIAMGYTITTMEGKTVHEPVKATALQAEVEKLTGQLKEAKEKATATAEQMEALQKENADLKAQVEKLTGQLKEATAKQAAQKAPDAGKQAETDAKATK